MDQTQEHSNSFCDQKKSIINKDITIVESTSLGNPHSDINLENSIDQLEIEQEQLSSNESSPTAHFRIVDWKSFSHHFCMINDKILYSISAQSSNLQSNIYHIFYIRKKFERIRIIDEETQRIHSCVDWETYVQLLI